jgi:type III secretion protein L
MAFWIRSGELELGVSDGVLRQAQFAQVVEVCALTTLAANKLSQASDRAGVIVAEALSDAEKRIAAVNAESIRIRADAKQQGLRDAAELWAQEMAEKAFDAQRSMQRASDRLAELVALATQRVIEVEDKEGLYRRALRTVRHLADGSKTLVLHIGADDAEYARSVVGQLAREIGIEIPLEVKVDSRITSGGCMLESDYGVIDASIGLQIQAVKRAITKAAKAALDQMNAAENAKVKEAMNDVGSDLVGSDPVASDVVEIDPAETDPEVTPSHDYAT